jgi:hypothetical protein
MTDKASNAIITDQAKAMKNVIEIASFSEDNSK